MVPWDFGSPSPRAKFVSYYIHGYTSTSKDWFLLLFIQNSLHCNKVVCMKHHFCLCTTCILRLLPPFPTRTIYMLYSGWYPPATIETGTYFYLCCYPLVTIETRTSILLRLLPTCYHRNKIKAGKILVITKDSRIYIQHPW